MGYFHSQNSWNKHFQGQIDSESSEEITVKVPAGITPWEADNDLTEQENLFPEYLEMGNWLIR